jgi:hypothetical protein
MLRLGALFLLCLVVLVQVPAGAAQARTDSSATASIRAAAVRACCVRHLQDVPQADFLSTPEIELPSPVVLRQSAGPARLSPPPVLRTPRAHPPSRAPPVPA